MKKKKIINGKKIAKKIYHNIFKKMNFILKKKKRKPGIAIILLGNNTSSLIYTKKKILACKKVNFLSKFIHLPKKTKQEKLIKIIKNLNKNKKIDGIIVQFPIPDHIKASTISQNISPKKDVDGFHPKNIGLLCQKNPYLRPCTSFGVMKILKKYKIKTHGLHAVIIGASNIVGRPMSLELLLAGCTTTVTHRFTKNLKSHTKRADILVSAVGKANFIKKNWIKPGAIIIDIGINKLKNGKIVGDVDFNSVYKTVSYITPVPGGVGPMTVAILLENTLKTYEKNKKL